MTNNESSVMSLQIAEVASAGMAVKVDPDIAETMGAFVEDALSAEDAQESRFDEIAEGGEQ